LGMRLEKNAKISVLIALLLVTAQVTSARTDSAPIGRSSAPRASQASQVSNSARIVTDEVGRRVTIPADIRRIVTLAPNLTETIYALGLADRLAGDTDYCDTPAAAQMKPHVGNPQNPSLEAIVALRPDLVLATTSINFLHTADDLARLGIPVYTTDERTVRGLLDSISHIAQITNAPDQGAALVSQLDARLQMIHAKLADRPPMHILFLTWVDPLISIGQNTFIADALRWAGGETVILADQNWPRVSMEEVVRLQPDFIVVTGNHDESGSGQQQTSELSSRPVWKSLQAVQLGRVVTVGEEFVRPAPGLIDEIEQLARALHPEVFATQENLPLSARCESCAR